MNSLELFFYKLYQYEISKRERTGSTQVIESPILDMNFDFADAPPATVNKPNDNNEKEDDKEMKENPPKKASIRKVNPPKSIKKKSVREDKEVKPKFSKRVKRVRNNLRIEMVGYEQKPNYAIRSNPNNKRKKMKEEEDL